MNSSAQILSASEAVTRLGVSAKALRLYEQRGLVTPLRNAAGWRVFGPAELARAAEIVALRGLGLSLAQVARVLAGDARGLEPALAEHQAVLDDRMRQLADAMERVRRLRAELARGQAPSADDLVRLLQPAPPLGVAFDLPWPWGGERFELRDIEPITYIVGPLGSGKTRLAKRLAETLPGAIFLGLERVAEGGAEARSRLEAEPNLRTRVERALSWLTDEGALVSDALVALLVGLETGGPAILVVDMVEHGLEQVSQEAVIAYVRRRAPGARPLVLLTRSSAILDLAAVGTDETIILCPANHGPPSRVTPHPGAPGYETVVSCLATPEVRARTEGVIAWRPQAA